MSALADELDVQAMPTFMLFRDGKKVETMVEPTPGNLLKLVEKGL
jgi:thioredoxin-like negative regulator of GroEL